MSLYWSPSQGRLIQAGQTGQQPKQTQSQQPSSPAGGGTRPQTYYSPSQGFVQSFDGKTRAFKPKDYDEEESQRTISDILGKIQSFNEFQSKQSDLMPKFSDLTPANRQSATRLDAAGGEVPGQGERKENWLERTIDVLSRPLYSSANVAKTGAETRQARAQDWRSQMESSLTDQEKQIIEQQTGKRLNDWFKDPTRLTGPGAQSIMSKYDSLRRQSNQSVKGPSAGEMVSAAGRGFTGKDKTTYKNVLELTNPSMPNWAKGGVGFLGDVFLDPLILVPGYVFTKPFTLAAKGTKALTHRGLATSSQIDESVRAVRTQGVERSKLSSELDKTREAWAAHFERELDSGVLDSKLFDRAFSTSPEIGNAHRLKAANDLTEQMGGRYSAERFGEFLEDNLAAAVREGRVSQETADAMLGSGSWSSLQEAVDASLTATQARAGKMSSTSSAVPPPSTLVGGATGAADEGLDAARQFVESVMDRGRVSQAIGVAQQTGRSRSALDKALADIKKQVGDKPNITGHLKSPKVRATHFSSGIVRSWANALRREIETGKRALSGGGGQQVSRSLDNIMAAPDKGVKRALTRALGKKSNSATASIGRLVDDYFATVGRPSREMGEEAYKAWHLGLLEHVETGLHRSVVDDLAEELVKAGVELPQTAGQPLVTGAAKASPKVDEAASQLGPPVPDDVKSIIEDTKKQVLDARKDFEESVLDFVARADGLSATSESLRSIHGLDEAMDKAVNLDLGVKATNIFDRAVDGFNRLFVPRAGLDPRIDEMRLRYMGMANENIQYRASNLRELFKGTNKKDRIAELNVFRSTGQMSPRLQEWDKQLTDIVGKYDWHRVPHAYGIDGSFTVGDINRWLPEKFKFLDARGKSVPKDNVFKRVREGRPLRSPRDVIRALMENPNVDPMEALWNFTIANEKAITEKATLRALAGSFGVTKESIAGSALVKKGGYVTNKKFGDDYYLHPEISRQVDKFFELVHSPRANNALVGYLDNVNNVFKQLVTTLNPVGFNVRNSMGDAFTGYLDGVSGARGLASYRQASKLMRLQKQVSEQAMEGIHKVGATQADLGNVRQALFRLPSGRSVSVEETMALYNKHGLKSGFIQTEFGAHASNLRPGANPVRSAIEPLQNLAQNQADFFRYAHFIDRMKRSKTGDLNKAAQEAAEAVRKFKFDYNDFTPFEKTVMSRIIPFYKFSRKNLPLMTSMLFAQPHRMLTVPKGLTSVSNMMGYEPEGFKPDYSADSVIPEWLQDRGMWPIGEWQDQTIYAQPDFQFFDPFQTTKDISSTTDMVSPALRVPLELGAGQRVFGNDLSPIGSGEPGKFTSDHMRHILGQVPQSRMAQQFQGDDSQINPGRVGQWAGLGTAPLMDKHQEQQIKMGWARFFDTPEGREFLESGPPKEISEKQIRYLMNLMAQENAPVRR